MIFRNLLDKKSKIAGFLKYLSVLVVFLFIVRNILNKWLAFTDFTPFSTNYFLTLKRFFYLWQPDFLGYMNAESISYIFRAFFEFISFHKPEVAQSLYIISFFIISYTGVYLLLKKAKVNPFIYYLVPFLYVINPTIIAEVANGAVGILIIYAFIPFAYILFFDLLEIYSLSKGIWLSFIIAIFLINIQTAFWILIGFVFITALKFITSELRIKNILYIFLHTILGVVINSVSIFSLLSTSKNYTNISYLDTFNYTYSNANIYNLFRLFGNFGSPQATLGYFDLNFFSILSFIFILIIAYYFITEKGDQFYKSKERDIAWFSIITMIFLIGFVHLIQAGYLNKLITEKNLIIVSVRNPQKIFYLFTFSYVMLLGLSLNNIFHRIKNKKSRIFPYVGVVAIVFIFLCSNITFFTGDFGLSKTKGSDKYYVTEKYQKINELLAGLNNNGYFLYLPFDYPMQLKTYWNDNLVKYRLGGNKTDSSNNPVAINNLYKSICSNENTDDYLNELGINYIVLDKSPITYEKHQTGDCIIESAYGTPYVWGDFKFFDHHFKSYKVFYEDGDYKIYKITDQIKEKIYPINHIYDFSSNFSLDSKLSFISNVLKDTPNYFVRNSSIENLYSSSLEDLFEDPDNIKVNLSKKELDYRYQNNFINKGLIYFIYKPFGQLFLNNKIIQNSNSPTPIQLSLENTFSYKNANFNYKNLISNPSFENGQWNSNVQDCYKYDSNPKIGMFLNRDQKSDGLQSITLEATRHFACTYQKIDIQGGKKFSLTFDYQSPNAIKAGYYIKFNDVNETSISNQMQFENRTWNNFSTTFTSPSDANNFYLYLYSYPIDDSTSVQTSYDNFNLKQIPDLVGNYFMYADSGTKYINPYKVEYKYDNPTKVEVKVSKASTPFYLAMEEAYNKNWKVTFNNNKNQGLIKSWLPLVNIDKISDSSHFAFNSFFNGWYVNTDDLCKIRGLCIQNSDGTYDLDLIIEFWPQRWFYLGLGISGVTILGSFAFLIYEWQKRRKIKTNFNSNENI